MKVDNSSTVVYNDKRNSVRLQTDVRYSVGSVWIADMIHVPLRGESRTCSLYCALPLTAARAVLGVACLVTVYLNFPIF